MKLLTATSPAHMDATSIRTTDATTTGTAAVVADVTTNGPTIRTETEETDMTDPEIDAAHGIAMKTTTVGTVADAIRRRSNKPIKNKEQSNQSCALILCIVPGG